MNEIKILKLITGEDIICKLVDENENYIKVIRPMGISPSPTGTGLAIFPWSVASLRPKDDEIFDISKNSVIMMHDALEEIATSYKNQTSKLYTPTVEEKSLILG